jgi:hypothetical protein
MPENGRLNDSLGDIDRFCGARSPWIVHTPTGEIRDEYVILRV